MSDKLLLEVEITSPHGRQPLEQFRHFLGKVSDEASERWGIDIQVRKQQPETKDTEFN